MATDKSGSDVTYQLDVPELEDLGPFMESIQAVTITKNRTALHQWRLVVKGSNNAREFFPTTANNVFSTINSEGHTSESVLTDKTVLGWRKLKFALAASNSSGTDLESAMVSVWLIVTWKS